MLYGGAHVGQQNGMCLSIRKVSRLLVRSTHPHPCFSDLLRELFYDYSNVLGVFYVYLVGFQHGLVFQASWLCAYSPSSSIISHFVAIVSSLIISLLLFNHVFLPFILGAIAPNALYSYGSIGSLKLDTMF